MTNLPTLLEYLNERFNIISYIHYNLLDAAENFFNEMYRKPFVFTNATPPKPSFFQAFCTLFQISLIY
jgi:hypothetical protein